MALTLKVDARARVLSVIDSTTVLDWQAISYSWEPLDQDTDRSPYPMGTAAMMQWWLADHATRLLYDQLANPKFNRQLVRVEFADIQYAIYQDGMATHISNI